VTSGNTVSLDDPAVRARLDTDGSYDRIHHLPEQCLEAWRQAKDFALPAGYGAVDKVVIVGMGGSAIAGDFLQALAFDHSPIPVAVVRGYRLPAWVDGRTLVITCSHSGNTEEVLSAFEQSQAAPTKDLVITTGGELARLATSAGIPALVYDYPNVPRDAFGHAFIRLLAVGRALDMVDVDDARIQSAVTAMQSQRLTLEAATPEASNPAKQTARRFAGNLPFPVGAEFMAPVARRWRTQVNENADVFGLWDELSELDHNLVVGLRHPADQLRRIRAVFLDHESLHPRIRLRYGLTMQLFANAGIQCQRLTFPQADRLAAQLCAVHFGDLVSYYLAMLEGTRPVEIDNINWLKDQLARDPLP
jgi:glucose/mannose-6-phosphate isomerase